MLLTERSVAKMDAFRAFSHVFELFSCAVKQSVDTHDMSRVDFQRSVEKHHHRQQLQQRMSNNPSTITEEGQAFLNRPNPSEEAATSHKCAPCPAYCFAMAVPILDEQSATY